MPLLIWLSFFWWSYFQMGWVFVLFSLNVNRFLLPKDTWKQLSNRLGQAAGRMSRNPLVLWVISKREISILPKNICILFQLSQYINRCVPFLLWGNSLVLPHILPRDVLDIHNILSDEFLRPGLWLSLYSMKPNCHECNTMFPIIKVMIHAFNYLWGNKLTLNPPTYGAKL